MYDENGGGALLGLEWAACFSSRSGEAAHIPELVVHLLEDVVEVLSHFFFGHERHDIKLHAGYHIHDVRLEGLLDVTHGDLALHLG